MKDLILHATLINGDLLLMGSDLVSELGLIRGNAVSLVFNSGSEEELKILYENLSFRGDATHPLKENFWGAIFGSVTDKFGNYWLLNYDKNQKK